MQQGGDISTGGIDAEVDTAQQGVLMDGIQTLKGVARRHRGTSMPRKPSASEGKGAQPPRLQPACAICGKPLDWPKRVADAELPFLKLCRDCFAKQPDDPGRGPDDPPEDADG